jgi:hypothetical protein
MTLRPPLRRGLDRASASAALAPTASEVAAAWRRPSSVARDQRPGRPFEEVSHPGRLPTSSQVDPSPEPELEEVSEAEERRISDAAAGRVSLKT